MDARFQAYEERINSRFRALEERMERHMVEFCDEMNEV